MRLRVRLGQVQQIMTLSAKVSFGLYKDKSYGIVRKVCTHSMPRAYKPLLPLAELRRKLGLSDDSPSGLVWLEETGWHKPGQVAGRLDHSGQYYVLSLYNEKYHAHRLEYYLRTGEDPGSSDVLKKENGELVLHKRKTPQPRSRRNCRKSDWT